MVDLLAKRWAVAALTPGEHRALLPGLLDLTFAQNRYGAMGLFGNQPALLIVLALAVLGLLSYLLRDTIARSPLAQTGFGLVAGGAAGNIYDRLVHGYVVDFVAPRGFYIFNLADVLIDAGIGLILIAAFRRRAQT